MSVNILFSILLFTLVFLALHTYFFYPIIIKIISFFSPAQSTSPIIRSVSIIISAYNEEKVINERINNIAIQKYDFSRVEVLVGSDKSSDRTVEILKQLEQKYSWLKIFIFGQRRGKAAVVNDLVKKAQHEILIFTDANTEFDESAISKLIEGFSDDDIGGVCGRLILNEANKNRFSSVEEKKYWKYETFIKKAEGRCGVLIGANGGIFAIRKSLVEEIPADSITDDFYITLSILKKNKKFIYKENALAYEEVGATVDSEYARKVRFSATNYRTLFYHSRRLLFNKNILLPFAFWSHKVIRWYFPFIMFGILILSLILQKDFDSVRFLLYFQIFFYTIGLLGYIFSLFNIRISFFSIVYFFIISNIALFMGFLKYIRGKQSTIWQSTAR